MKVLVGILLILTSLINIGRNIYEIWIQFFAYGDLSELWPLFWSLWWMWNNFVMVLVGVVLVFDKKGN